MLKVFMIYLGTNMWHEKDCLRRFNKNDPKFYDEMYTDRETWRRVTDYLAELEFNTLLIDIGEGLRFDSHPELAARGAWTKPEMKAEIDRLKAKGIVCVPKLNFSSCHDAWLGEYGHKLTTPEYRRVIKDLIDEAIELFQPPLFHYGFDEESRREKHMQNDYGYSAIRYGELYWEDEEFCVRCITNKGVRPWSWSGRSVFQPDEEFSHLSKEVVVSQSNYGCNFLNFPSAPDYLVANLRVSEVFNKLGYTMIPLCSTCYNYLSVDESVEHFVKTIDKKLLLGLATTPWCRTGKDDLYSLLADAKIFDTAMRKYLK